MTIMNITTIITITTIINLMNKIYIIYIINYLSSEEIKLFYKYRYNCVLNLLFLKDLLSTEIKIKVNAVKNLVTVTYCLMKGARLLRFSSSFCSKLIIFLPQNFPCLY